MLQSRERSHSSTDRTGVSEISDVGSIPAEGTSSEKTDDEIAYDL